MPTAKSGLIAGVLALLTAVCAVAETYGHALNDGARLSPDAAQQLEASLRTNPNDLLARARLLGYYSGRATQDSEMRGARLRQIEWLIGNAPACPLLHELAARLQPADFAAPYSNYEETLRRAWQQQIDRKPDDALVTENAYRSLGVVDARENNGEKSVPFLKRLRTLERGDPQWAADLATVYGFALLRGEAPGANAVAKQFQAAVTAGLEKSNDAAVAGYLGISLYGGALMTAGPQTPQRTALQTLGESLLRRAAELNPKNPGWTRALYAMAPKTAAELGALITSTLEESDLWPGGAAQEMTVPPGAVRLPADKLRPVPQFVMVGGRKVLEGHVAPPSAVGASCSVRFDALIGREGQVESVEVVGFDGLKIPFEASERDWLRETSYEPTLVNGRAVEVVARFDRKCPTGDARVAGVAGGVPGGVAGGAAGGVLGGILAGIPSSAPPPPPPPRQQPAGGSYVSIAAKAMEAQLTGKVEPIYPELARQARIQGLVRLAVVVNQEGRVESIEKIDGHPLLTPAAINAVKQWVYKPVEIAGKPVKVKTEVDVIFTLGK